MADDRVFEPTVPARGATLRRVWYRRPVGQTATLSLPVLLAMFMTILIAGVAGSVKIGLILGGVELLLGAVAAAALTPLMMLRPDAIRIWHGVRFTNIGISDIAGIGMLVCPHRWLRRLLAALHLAG